MSSIVVLKSAASVKGGKGEDMALTEVQRAHDAAWNCPAVDGGNLQYKLSEEVIRRSAEWRRTFSAQNEKENMKMEQEEEEEEEEEDEEMDEQGLRNRVWALEEDKGRLHKDLAAMTLKETILRDKVREFEMQMDAHRKRVERAERTILELRQAAAQSTKQARQSEKDVEEMRLRCARSDGEKADLQVRVERLQQLCLDHEKSIHGLRQGLKNGTDGNKEGRMSRLQKELQRLSGVEISLRTDLEASRVENSTLRRDINCLLERFANQQREAKLQLSKLEQELRSEIDRGQARVAELQDDNSVLFAKLRLLTRERQDSREALRCCNNQVADLEDENRSLQEQVSKVEKAVEVKQMQVEQLESSLERSRQNQEIAQTALALKDKATLNEKEPLEKIAPQMRESLQAAAQQLYSMNERLEKLMDKLSERDLQLQEARAEVAGKDEVITGLEHTLSNLAKTVDSQSARLMRISKQNEDLTRVTQLQARQVEEFQARIAQAVESKSKAEQELQTARKRLEEFAKDYESQGLTCQLLQERVDGLEAELNQCHPQITSLRHEREELEVERENLHHSLADVTLRATDLEHRLADKEQVVKLQEEALEDLRRVVEEGRKELSLAQQERDEMQKEAEAMSREALRTSVEVEVLRRRVRQLDEDVLLRDGQICILRGGLEDS